MHGILPQLHVLIEFFNSNLNDIELSVNQIVCIFMRIPYST
jgi:hypothetical protein